MLLEKFKNALNNDLEFKFIDKQADYRHYYNCLSELYYNFLAANKKEIIKIEKIKNKNIELLELFDTLKNSELYSYYMQLLKK